MQRRLAVEQVRLDAIRLPHRGQRHRDSPVITLAVEAYVEDQRPAVPVSGGREQASDRGRAISRRNTSGSSPPSTGGTSPSAPVSPLPISCVAIQLRSIAIESARRTRISSNGALRVLKAR